MSKEWGSLVARFCQVRRNIIYLKVTHLVDVNWENTRMFLVTTVLDNPFKEIKQEDYKLKKLDQAEVLCKIVGEVGDTVSFQDTETCSQTPLYF